MKSCHCTLPMSSCRKCSNYTLWSSGGWELAIDEMEKFAKTLYSDKAPLEATLSSLAINSKLSFNYGDIVRYIDGLVYMFISCLNDVAKIMSIRTDKVKSCSVHNLNLVTYEEVGLKISDFLQ